MIKTSLDFETYSECDIRKAGAWAYATHESTRVLCMAYAYNEDAPQLWLPNKTLPDFLSDPNQYEIHAWNSFFEWVIWTHVLKLPTPPITQWYDTASLASAMALPRSLGECGYVLGMPEDKMKNKRGYYLISKLSKPHKENDDPELLKEMYAYCKQDVITERAISKKLCDLNETERKIWVMDQDINIRGIKVDTPMLKDAMSVYETIQNQLAEKLKKLTGLDNPNSQKQFLGWLLDQGVVVNNIQKATLKNILETPDKHGVHEAVKLKLSLAKTAPKKYISIKERLGRGTRLHGNIMYHGASTGRWASTGVNLQNIARPTLDPEMCIDMIRQKDLELFRMTDTDPMEALSSAVRGTLIPSEGKKFIVGDYASIESRVLAWLAGQQDKLDIFSGHGKIYEHSASKIFRKPIEDITKEERFLGKIAELACGYGGGVRAFSVMAKNYGVDIPRKQAEKLKQEWRKSNKAIVDFWWALEEATKDAIWNNKITTITRQGKKIPGVIPAEYGVTLWMQHNFLWCRLPSGRNLAYYRPHCAMKKILCYKIPPTGGDPELTFLYNPIDYKSKQHFLDEAEEAEGEPFEFEAMNITFFGTDSITRKWCKRDTFGGKLAENVTQAVARDIMAEAMLVLEKERYDIVLTVHDEIISEVKNGDVERFKTIMENAPEWAKTLPITVEAYEATRYRK